MSIYSKIKPVYQNARHRVENTIMINFLKHHKQNAVIKIHWIHTVNTDNDMPDPMSESYTGQRETLNIH